MLHHEYQSKLAWLERFVPGMTSSVSNPVTTDDLLWILKVSFSFISCFLTSAERHSGSLHSMFIKLWHIHHQQNYYIKVPVHREFLWPWMTVQGHSKSYEVNKGKQIKFCYKRIKTMHVCTASTGRLLWFLCVTRRRFLNNTKCRAFSPRQMSNLYINDLAV